MRGFPRRLLMESRVVVWNFECLLRGLSCRLRHDENNENYEVIYEEGSTTQLRFFLRSHEVTANDNSDMFSLVQF